LPSIPEAFLEPSPFLENKMGKPGKWKIKSTGNQRIANVLV
jgi:hypothetical protein